jgi:glycosyltransferase involved in cell wall biosynthesis
MGVAGPMRIAWFSPVPPNPSGITAYTQEILPLLAGQVGAIDLYVDQAHPGLPAHSGHLVHPVTDFVWRHNRHPYDLTVYQLGNASCHDYMWAYLFRYPGLVVLHDLQLHQSRALWLLRRLEPRLDDYLAELRANHPDAPPDLGYLVAAGLGGSLFRLWPMLTLVIRASRLVAVHNTRAADALAAAHPDAAIARIRMGVADPDRAKCRVHRSRLRATFGVPDEAVLVGAFGGITPEKRIAELLQTVTALRDRTPPFHVLLVGQRADHYDVDADIRARGLEGRVHVAGYVPDAELPAYLAAVDLCACLRWPSNGETSASWLRTLAAGQPTIVTRLAALEDVPALVVENGALTGDEATAIAVAIDPVDEEASLPVALKRLVVNADLRRQLGENARDWWRAHHRLELMAGDYARVIETAAARPAPPCDLPPHLLDEGTGTARAILRSMAVGALPW